MCSKCGRSYVRPDKMQAHYKGCDVGGMLILKGKHDLSVSLLPCFCLPFSQPQGSQYSYGATVAMESSDMNQQYADLSEPMMSHHLPCDEL